MRRCCARADFGNQPLTCFQQGIQRQVGHRHAEEPVAILASDIEPVRAQQFVRRARVADEIDQESFEEIVADAFIGEEECTSNRSRGCWRSSAAAILPA